MSSTGQAEEQQVSCTVGLIHQVKDGSALLGHVGETKLVLFDLLAAHPGLAGDQIKMHGLSRHLARDHLDVRNADVSS